MAAYQRRYGGISTNVACSMIPSTMDKGSNPQSHEEQLAPPNSNLCGNNNKDHEDSNQRPQYTIPGIVHYIQHEWARFEMDRAQWEVEKAELQAKIAYLQGERKGQENLKSDLVRRIKMLEFALKQERAKYHKLKYGTDLQQGDMKPPSFEEGPQMEGLDADSFIPPNTNVSWKQGRHLLRQYLIEIGYTDTIIDVRSARVRSLLGVGNNDNEENHNIVPNINGSDSKRGDNQKKRPAIKRSPHDSIVEGMLMDAEAAVMANFDFLSSEHIGDIDDDDNIRIDGEEEEDNQLENNRRNANWNKMVLNDGIDDGDAETENVMSEFHFLHSTDDAIDGRNANDAFALQGGGFTSGSTTRKQIVGSNNEEDVIDGTLESGLGLGELAQLTVNNDAEMGYDISSSKEAFRKTWNAKYSLRSHFDGVRALAFHPVEPVLITASEDHTLKLWNLQKTVPAKKSASLDVEPVYTFRAHTAPVLCLALNGTGDICYSGGLDSTINCWAVPSPSIDPYDTFDSSVVSEKLHGHQDAVWDLALHSTKSQLLSCSSDGTVKLWTPGSKQPLLSTFTSEKDGIPTSIDYIRCDPSSSIIVTAYTSGNCVLWDLETSKPVLRLEGGQEESMYHQINCVVSHPTLPLTITAHEDRNIRFFDNTSGKMVHHMIAHLDAVTSLAIDPNGLYLLSGSHDCSIRLWNLDTKACVQEITSHRKKFDESIFDVAFHPSKPYIASAGADGLAKVFV